MLKLFFCFSVIVGLALLETTAIISMAGLALASAAHSTAPGHAASDHGFLQGGMFLGLGFIAYFVVFLLGNSIYFLPSVVAGVRQSHQFTAIFVLNFLLGWTFIGWVISLVMAFVKFDRPS